MLDDSIERFDLDTSAGYLVEIIIRRKKEIDRSKLKGKRFRHMKASFQSEEKLEHGIQDDDKNDSNSQTNNDGNDNDNNNNNNQTNQEEDEQ